MFFCEPRRSEKYCNNPLLKCFSIFPVSAPILAIMDDSGRIKSGERHLKAGSALRLKCEVKDIHNESVTWTRGDETLTDDVRLVPRLARPKIRAWHWNLSTGLTFHVYPFQSQLKKPNGTQKVQIFIIVIKLSGRRKSS